MYKIFMLIAIPVLIIGWVVYWIWMRKVIEEEKKLSSKQPSSETQKLIKDIISNFAEDIKELLSGKDITRARRILSSILNSHLI